MKLPTAGGGGGNAKKINGKQFVDAGSGLPPTSTPPQFYLIAYAPDFGGGVHAYVDPAQVAPGLTEFTLPFVNLLTSNAEVDSVNEANSGTVNFSETGAELDTNAANSGEAGFRIPNDIENDEISWFETLRGINIAFDGLSLGSQTGDAEMFFGIVDQSDYSIPDETTLVSGVWIYWKVVSGVETVYFCTSDGSAITATDITDEGGPPIAAKRIGLIKFTQGSGGSGPDAISYHRSGSSEALATHTTNLPSGVMTNKYRFIANLQNGASDTQNRQLKFSNITQYIY